MPIKACSCVKAFGARSFLLYTQLSISSTFFPTDSMYFCTVRCVALSLYSYSELCNCGLAIVNVCYIVQQFVQRTFLLHKDIMVGLL